MKIINAPYVFSTTYLPNRKKDVPENDRTAEVHDFIPVKVEETTSAQAPVAVRAVLDGQQEPTEYRYHDGRLWQKVERPEAGSDAEALAGIEHKLNPFVPRDSIMRRKDIPNFDFIQVKKVRSDTRLVGSAQAHARAQDLLIIDGDLHEASIGPVLVLRLTNAREAGEVILADGLAEDGNLIPSSMFRVDQRSQAMAYYDTLSKRAPAISFEDAEILIPEALSQDMSDIALVETARSLFTGKVNSIGIGNLPVDFLDAYLDYTHEDFDRGRATPELEDLVERASVALDGVRECAVVSKTGKWIIERRAAERALTQSPEPKP